MKCRTDFIAVDGKMNTRKKHVSFPEKTMAYRMIYEVLEVYKTKTMRRV